MSRRQIIADTETSGLDPTFHDIYEIGLIERDSAARIEHRWLIQPDESRADKKSLDIGGYHKRTAGVVHGIGAVDLMPIPEDRERDLWSDPYALASELCPLLYDVTLICAVPTFDSGFLDKFLLRHGCRQRWHYRVRDIGSIVYGYLCALAEFGTYFGEIPSIDAGTDEFARALGINLDRYDRHTALGDCRLVADMLDAVEGVVTP